MRVKTSETENNNKIWTIPKWEKLQNVDERKKDGLSNQRDIANSWAGRFNTVKIPVLTKFIWSWFNQFL